MAERAAQSVGTRRSMWRQWTRVAALLASAHCVLAQFGDLFSNMETFGMSMVMNEASSCFNTQNGFTTANAHPYTQHLEAQRSEFDIPVPQYPGCSVAGVSVSSCERGGASTSVQLEGMARARVHRAGDLRAPGALDIVVYCA